MVETKKVEYKREYTDDIKYTVIAFANSEGGKLYIEPAILKMIKETSGESYEQERSLNQTLTFTYAASYFSKGSVTTNG